MPQACSVCEHPQSLEIDAALLADEPVRATARMYGLTESALRRHAANHRPQESGEIDPGAPARPADAPEEYSDEPQEPPASAAARLLEREERERRDARLRELTAQEEARRDREEAARERERQLRALREQANVLAVSRGELEDRAEAELGPLLRTLGELEALDRRHLSLLSRAGLLRAGQQPVTSVVRLWLQVRFGESSPAGGIPVAMDPYGGAPLSQRDPLTKPPDERQPHGPHNAA